jgi:polar amino acid transport system permease protein
MFPTSEEITTWMPELLGGLSISLQVTALSLLFGIPFGLLLSLGVLVHNKVLRVGSLLLVEIGRGAPALVLLQFIYFGLPTTGLTVDSFPAAVIALAWNTGA